MYSQIDVSHELTAANFVIHSSDTPSDAKPISCDDNNIIKAP